MTQVNKTKIIRSFFQFLFHADINPFTPAATSAGQMMVMAMAMTQAINLCTILPNP